MIPVRLELRDGQTMWRGVRSLEHGELCRAFSLDPATFYFDLPSSARGIGSNTGRPRDHRRIDGYVMHGLSPEPFGRLTVASEGEKFRDLDPRDFHARWRM